MAGTLITSTLQGTTLTDGTNSTSTTNCIQGSAKAWVNYKGTATQSIRASYNVSSVTYSASGKYIINFTNAFSDANYCIVCGGDKDSGAQSSQQPSTDTNTAANTTTAAYIANARSGSSSYADGAYIYVAVFR